MIQPNNKNAIQVRYLKKKQANEATQFLLGKKNIMDKIDIKHRFLRNNY